MRRRTRDSVIVGLCLALAPAWSPASQERRAPNNIVMIVVDDMRFDEFGAGGHSYLETPNIDRLAREGATFSRAYHATPLCSPNRASILTGQYASRHGILDNTSRSHASHRLALFPQDLQRAGYRTAHVGKWHMGNDPTPRPGYDYWVSFAGQGKTNDPDLFENGAIHNVEGYITDIFTDRAIDFIEDSAKQPFFLYVGHKAIHPEARQRDDGTVDVAYGRKFIPAERHAGRYEGQVVERRPNYGITEAERKTKPVLARALEIKHSPRIQEEFEGLLDPGIAEETVRRRAEMMLAVDEGVGRIVGALESLELLDDTLIIFTSDNGYFYGEHGLGIERRLPYEESARAPLLIRFPRLVKPGTRVDALVASVDLAATALDLAGAPIPSHVQGRSLLPLLSGEAESIRDSLLVEYYGHENPMPWTANLDYRVVFKGRHKYIRWIRFEDAAELYDLEADPYEQTNLIDEPRLQGVVRDMRRELETLTLASLGLAGPSP